MNFDQDEKEFFTNEDSSFDIKSIIPKILRIWPFILGSMLVFLMGSYVMTRMTVPQFKVSGLFFIKESDSGFSLFDAPTIQGTARTGLVNEVTILQSRPIAYAALSQLNFTVEYYAKGTFINTELYQNTPILVEVNWKEPQVMQGFMTIRWEGNDKYTLSFEDKAYSKYLPDGTKTRLEIIPEPQDFPFGEWISNNNFSIRVSKTSSDEEGEVLIKLRDLSSLAEQYAGSLNVESIQKDGSILELSINTPSVRKGEDYINKLMETYLSLEL